MKTAEHIRRLEILEQELLAFYERHRADIFDMIDFATIMTDKHDFNICKTACCVAGLAGLVPEFQVLGLVTDLQRSLVRLAGCPFFRSSGENAGKFFGLTSEERNQLFYECEQQEDNEGKELVFHTHTHTPDQSKASA